MGKFMKRAVLGGASSAYKIAKLNVLDSATPVAPSEVDIGFAAKTTLEKVHKEKKISQLQVLEFRKECESVLTTTVAKNQERSPLKYQFCQEASKSRSKGYGIKSRPSYKNVPRGVTETD